MSASPKASSLDYLTLLKFITSNIKILSLSLHLKRCHVTIAIKTEALKKYSLSLSANSGDGAVMKCWPFFFRW